jgi:dihydropyrimidine dehydrogenase (NAD+) subunit PreT
MPPPRRGADRHQRHAGGDPRQRRGARGGIRLYRSGETGLEPTGETFRLPADQVFTAIGQTLSGAPEGLAKSLSGRKLDPNALPTGVWAGGDCAAGGDDLTVTAVAQGRDAAENIHKALMGA